MRKSPLTMLLRYDRDLGVGRIQKTECGFLIGEKAAVEDRALMAACRCSRRRNRARAQAFHLRPPRRAAAETCRSVRRRLETESGRSSRPAARARSESRIRRRLCRRGGRAPRRPAMCGDHSGVARAGGRRRCGAGGHAFRLGDLERHAGQGESGELAQFAAACARAGDRAPVAATSKAAYSGERNARLLGRRRTRARFNFMLFLRPAVLSVQPAMRILAHASAALCPRYAFPWLTQYDPEHRMQYRPGMAKHLGGSEPRTRRAERARVFLSRSRYSG